MALRRANTVTSVVLLLYGPRTSTGTVALATLPSAMAALNRGNLLYLLLLLLFLALEERTQGKSKNKSSVLFRI